MPQFGFDIVPRLPDTPEVQQQWARLIDWFRPQGLQSPRICFYPHYVEFLVGDNPILPLSGHDFLRFSSTVPSSEELTRSELFITVMREAIKGLFGSRVLPWDERSGEEGFYRWCDIEASIRFCKEPKGSKPSYLYDPVWMSEYGFFCLGYDPLKLVTVVVEPDKRKSTVAQRAIPAGTRIVREAPLLVVPRFPIEELEREAQVQLRELPEDDQRDFLSLRNASPEAGVFAGIVATKGLRTLPDSDDVAVYASDSVTSSIIHSCVPNSHYAWNDELGYGIIHTIRRVEPGEEITIAYSPEAVFPSSLRSQRIKKSKGFKCRCQACSLSPKQLKASDSRRAEMLKLAAQICSSNDDPVRHWQDSLYRCHRLTQLSAAEYPGSFGPWMYLTIAYGAGCVLCLRNNDIARAKGFIRRWYDTSVIYQGKDHPETRVIKKSMDVLEARSYDIWLKKRETEFDVASELPAWQFRAWL